MFEKKVDKIIIIIETVMNVLICLPWLSHGGTEVQTMNMTRALVSSGYNVIIVCYYGYSREIIEQFESTGAIVELFSSDQKWLTGMKENWHLLVNFVRVVFKYKPQIAHVQYVNPGAKPCLILKLLGVRHVLVTIHTNSDIFSNFRILHFITRYVADAVTCISQASEMGCYGSINHEVSVINNQMKHLCLYNALPKTVSIVSTPRVYRKAVMIGFVGRLAEIKGADIVVPAFNEVHKIFPETRLLVVGDGPLRSLMENQIIEYGIDGSVEMTGMLPVDSIQAQYDRIDVLWMPSRSEGFGLSALEAMARGCPIIASDTGGLAELVNNAECGLLSIPGSVESLIENTSTIMNSKSMYEKFSEKAIEGAHCFSYENYKKKLISLYNHVICLR